MASDVFALLDDGNATQEQPLSRLYTGLVREHRCTDPRTLDAVCAAVQTDLSAGRHAVLLADYEWGVKLLRAGMARLAAMDHACLRVLVFDTMARLDRSAVDAWLACQDNGCGLAEPTPAGVLDLAPSIGLGDFTGRIARIHDAIRAGETYQVNYTYRLRGRAWGSPLALYRRLRSGQQVSFGALLRLPVHDGDTTEWVLSRSPELFVRHRRGRLEARPMKGTAARAAPAESDSETARLLHADAKNRAENLMIVDLLRNDLGRIAEVGSVRVPHLFSIEQYATVFQMTSTVEATRRVDVGLAALLRALFPCGSITGAPKHRTMDWIAALEPEPRGLYTGTIGWLEHGDGVCPDLCLSVAIRTLTLGPELRDRRSGRELGVRPLTVGVGGGIVHDSIAADEYEETRWKARFLTEMDPGVALFETMHATAERGIARRACHRARLAASAHALGFVFDPQAFDAALDAALAHLRRAPTGEQPLRLRVQLAYDGRLDVTRAPLATLPAGPLRVRVADQPLPAARPLSMHKTTLRSVYDQGVREAEAHGAFDTLFFGAHGRLVEGGRSNVFVRIDGGWVTPPLTDGALPGVMRAAVLRDPAWNARVRSVTRADLARAEAVMVCNALRGTLPVIVDHQNC